MVLFEFLLKSFELLDLTATQGRAAAAADLAAIVVTAVVFAARTRGGAAAARGGAAAARGGGAAAQIHGMQEI